MPKATIRSNQLKDIAERFRKDEDRKEITALFLTFFKKNATLCS